MDFEEWWKDCMGWTEYEPDPREKALAQAAWEAGYNGGFLEAPEIDEDMVYQFGIQEGIKRMYLLYDICPECREVAGRHKMDCSNGR